MTAPAPRPSPVSSPVRTDAPLARRRLEVAGAVQGVGFRPFAHRLATGLGLAGWVCNAPGGVRIEVEGPAATLDAFAARLRESPPALARIEAVTAADLPAHGAAAFEIRPSAADAPSATAWLPDLATCPDCLAEVLDPADRRYRHPFASCTVCGPRDSIVLALPYDRASTTMRDFAMCPRCRAEYADPADRRFHAQPIACPDCGPRLALWDARGDVLATRDEALRRAAEVVRGGGILALKALGGFQLIVDARDDQAVARLRARKRRPDKPFAVMVRDLAAARAPCVVSEAEAAALTGPAAPIVLLRRRPDTGLAAAVAPGLAEHGVMLPATPLHHLLLRELDGPVVATSGNLAGAPLETDETRALERLGGIADAFLVHDRPIARRLDDSVVRAIAGRPTVLRAARGIAPVAVELPVPVARPVAAFGGHLKAAPAVARDRRAVLGAHVGDLDTPEARRAFAARLDQLRALHGTAPEVALHDRHPDYATTRLARDSGLPARALQHHAAHLAAALADAGRRPPALGAVWDGTGDGGDGTVWGGELLRLNADGAVARLAHLRPFPLPGGEAAVREPRRAALGLLHAVHGPAAVDAPEIAAGFTDRERALLRTALARGVNAPTTTSAGRLIDGLAWLLGLVEAQSWEGQAGARLEAAALAAPPGPDEAPALAVVPGDGAMHLDWAPLLAWVRAERCRLGANACAAGVHAALARGLVDAARALEADALALSGGCFQNRVLVELTVAGLRAAGIEAVRHGRVPPNDGGLALGQAALAAFRGDEE